MAGEQLTLTGEPFGTLIAQEKQYRCGKCGEFKDDVSYNQSFGGHLCYACI